MFAVQKPPPPPLAKTENNMATEVVHRVRFVSFRFVFFSFFSTIFPMMDFQNFNGCCLALPRTAEQALKSSHSPSSSCSPFPFQCPLANS